MRRDREFGPIDDVTGLPVEYVSCPGCNRVYGYRGRKACTVCDECSSCCRCGSAQVLIEGIEMRKRAGEQA